MGVKKQDEGSLGFSGDLSSGRYGLLPSTNFSIALSLKGRPFTSIFILFRHCILYGLLAVKPCCL